MATKCVVNKSTLTDIATAIRTKGGTTDTLLPSEMPAAISAIPSGGDVTVEPLTTDTNGTFTAPEGKAYSPVEVKVDNVWPKPWKGTSIGGGETSDNVVHLWFYFAPNVFPRAYFNASYISDGHTFKVDWGDGQIEDVAASTDYTTRELSHDYTIGGYYEVTIYGYDSISLNKASVLGAYNSAYTPSYISCRQIEMVGNMDGTMVSNIYCGLGVVSVEFPASLTIVGTSAFIGNASLKSVGGLENVTSIGATAFHRCLNLLSVGTLPNVETISINAFNNCPSLKTIGDMPLLTALNGSVFLNCPALESVGDMPSVTSIGIDAFSGCTSLKTIGDLSALTSISTRAFNYCDALESITFGNATTGVGKSSEDVKAISGWTILPARPTCIFHCTDGDFYRSGTNLIKVES